MTNEATQVSVIDRAIKALDVNEAALRDLVKESIEITAVTNPDGNAQAQTARMKLRSARVQIEKTGKAAREDATAFCKAVIAKSADYIGIIEPEEDRLNALQESYAAKIQAEKQAKIDAENERIAAIERALDGLGFQLAFGDTSADISAKMQKIQATEITIGVFAEKILHAEQIKAASISMLKNALEKIQAEEKLVEQRKIEAERMRAEMEQIEAQLAAERAEKERIENEQRAEIARLTELARVEKEARDKLEADERQRQAEIVRAENARLARIEAEKQAEERAARIAAEEEASRLRAEAAAIAAAKMAEDCARIEAERKAAAAPDKEKLIAFAESLVALKIADMQTPAGMQAKLKIEKAMLNLHSNIISCAEGL